MRDTIEDVDLEIEQKDIETEFSENKIRLPDSKVIEEMNKLGVDKISNKQKVIALSIREIIRSLITNTTKTKINKFKHFK